MSNLGDREPEYGPVLVCPNEGKTPEPHGACRVGSPYYLEHLGACARCKARLVKDVDANRVRGRGALYRFGGVER